MKVLVRPRPGFVEVVDRSAPELNCENEVRVRIQYAGICGGDLTYFRGVGHTAHISDSFIVCHEAVGVVESGASDLVGSTVVIDPLITCNSCHQCIEGRPQLCPLRRDMGYGADGVAAEIVKVDRSQVLKVSDELATQNGVLIHGLAAVLHSLSRVPELNAVKSARVIGPGPAGLMFAMRLRQLGVETLLVGRRSWRLELANALGIQTFEIEDDGSIPGGFELTIDTTGVAGVLEEALSTMPTRGSLLLYAPGNFILNATTVFRKELNIFGSTGAPDTMSHAIDVLKLHHHVYEQLLTHNFTLAKGPEAFELASSQPANRGRFLKAYLCLV